MLDVKPLMFAVVLFTFFVTSLASATPDTLSMAKLDHDFKALTAKVQTLPQKADRLAIIERYLGELRPQIRQMANSGIRNDVYWRAIDIRTQLINIVDLTCAESRTVLESSEFNMSSNDSGSISADTAQAIALLEQVCRKN